MLICFVDALLLQPHDNPSACGDQTSQTHKEARGPAGSVESIHGPHADSQTDLKDGVQHVSPDHHIHLPQRGGQAGVSIGVGGDARQDPILRLREEPFSMDLR